ncbi:ribonuclease Z [Fulvivirgaceae bacterium BMA10]|uniref:Ribonuclease Z n=1 Tax=Splendidivirga corallicola TaxID=3051826 RepID=A0ABT8KG72_9BACT|nr:ribonuclease Z [Fulvivirgaceae bacterium BMA10]
MSFKLQILGANSAKPAYDRNQTAQILTVQNDLFLIDCGEGTQLQLNKYRIKINRIRHIFISHLHGDHYYGLIGLLSTMHLQRRTTELYLYGPPGLSEILALQFKYSDTVLNYKLHFREIETEKKYIIFENDNITVETIPLTHRIPCAGFLFREKTKPMNLIKEKVNNKFSLADIATLKQGKDIVDENGTVVHKNRDYTHPAKKCRSYAYCSDTRYNEGIVDQIKDVDLLYHEATFLSEREERAGETYHSTAGQAASIAQKANVGTLIIGHYSSRYKDLSPFLDEAKLIYNNTMLAIEGECISIND